MIVRNIYDDVRSITGYTDEDVNFGRITDAVITLSNNGDFDILHGYLDIAIPTGSNLIALPQEVETVVKVNIDGTPSFSRDRLYEFTLNGPGSNTERVDFSWEDRGEVPIMTPLPVTASVTALPLYTVSDPVDDGKTITLYGTDFSGGDVTDTIVLSAASPNGTAGGYSTITRVVKDITQKKVGLRSGLFFGIPDTAISTFDPRETEPTYRQIRISKTGVTAHILYRRRVFQVTDQDDFIPIRSKMGLIYMIQALEAYRRQNPELGSSLEAVAVKLATQEQKAHNSFIEIATNTEAATIRGINYNNSDSIIVADIFDEVSAIKGPIGTPAIYDVITEAHEALANKSIQWDGMNGIVDIVTDQYHYVTLPRYVEVPIKMNLCGEPSTIRNKWFEFHLNGTGSRNWCSCSSMSNDVGDVVTFRDVNYSQQIVAVPDLDEDVDTEMRGYGYYQGKRIYTDGVDGFPIACNRAASPTGTYVDRIERITKAVSTGFIKLLGFDSSRNVMITIGYYWPDETEPNYRRIYINQASAWVRLLYRRRTRKISSLTDPLHLKSKLAIVTMVRSIAALQSGKLDEAMKLDQMAEKYLTNEQMTRNPNDVFQFEIGPTDGADRMGNIV